MEWTRLDLIAQRYGNSYFVLDEAAFRKNFKELNDAFNTHYPHTKIGYSYKTNYTPQLCRIVQELGGFAEVVSEMEYNLTQKLGIPGDRIIYNGPYKSLDSLANALTSGTVVNLDSMRDVKNLVTITTQIPDAEMRVAVRCNFALSEDSMSRFGMDVQGEEFAATLAQIDQLPNVELAGLHCHFPDRDLASFGRRAKKLTKLAKEIFGNVESKFLNIGGGFFGKMPESLKTSFDTEPPSFEDYAKLVGEIFTEAFGDCETPPLLFLEPGTALVADTLRFYSRVISTKQIRHKRFATIAGSIFDISPTARSMTLPITAIHQDKSLKNDAVFDVAGYTCIEKDILTRDFKAPLEVDDFVSYENVGSYSVVMKPPFILPGVAILANVAIENVEDITVIKHAENTDYIFQNFEF